MTKRGKIRIAAAVLGTFLVLLIAWLGSGAMLRASETRLEYAYRRALNDLTDYVSGMEDTLEKAPYVGTPTLQYAVSAKLLEQSGGAKGSLGVLPFSQEKTDRISRFLSQVGDYALSLTRQSAGGAPLSEQDLQNLQVLAEYAGKLETALEDAQSALQAEQISLGRTENLLNNVDEVSDLPPLDDSFDETAAEFSQFPALLYDGPFSDHVQNREAQYLKGKQKITEEEARKKAARLLEVPEDRLTSQGLRGKELSVYSFSLKSEEGVSRVNVTEAGGEISYFKKDGAVPASLLTAEEALEFAKKALRAMGIERFRESYYVTDDGLFTVNFSALDELSDPPAETGGDVICYPDLIKVTVELNAGTAVEYDAAGYLMNHREREFDPPALSPREAAESLSPLLFYDDIDLALIPTPGKGEVLCYEFHCQTDSGQELISYVNLSTGQEEQLFLLQRDDHGVLVS